MGLDIYLYKVVDPSTLSKEDLDNIDGYKYSHILIEGQEPLQKFSDKFIERESEYYDFEPVAKVLSIDLENDTTYWRFGHQVEIGLKEGVYININPLNQPFVEINAKEFAESNDIEFDPLKSLKFYIIDNTEIAVYDETRVFIENCHTIKKNELFLICEEIGYQRKGHNSNFGLAVREERLEEFVTTLDRLLEDEKEYFTHELTDLNLNDSFRENIVSRFIEGEHIVQYSY